MGRPGRAAGTGRAGRGKGAPGRRCPHCHQSAWDKGRAGRTALRAAGDVRPGRLDLACPRCHASRYPLDQRLGVQGSVSPHAKKLRRLAGASWSFDRAAEYLAESCGLRTCDQTIRAACHEEAGLMADWLHTDPQAGAGFARAAGAVEFQADDTVVNTTAGGWRASRPGVFAEREPAGSGSRRRCCYRARRGCRTSSTPGAPRGLLPRRVRRGQRRGTGLAAARA